MDGSKLIGVAQERIARWLQREPGIELRGDPYSLANAVVIHVMEALNGEHVLVITETGWRLEHDLRCHIGVGKGCVLEEPLRAWLREVGRPTEPPGRYVVNFSQLKRGRGQPIVLEQEKRQESR